MENKEAVAERMRRYRAKKRAVNEVAPERAEFALPGQGIPVLLKMIDALENRVGLLESRVLALESRDSVEPVVDRVMKGGKRSFLPSRRVGSENSADDLFRRVMEAKERRLGVR